MMSAFVSSLPLLSVQAKPFHGKVSRPFRAPTFAAQRTPSRPATIAMSSSTPPIPEVVAGPFEGKYGVWHLTSEDVSSVQAYRTAVLSMALSTAAMTFLALTNAAQTGEYVWDGLALFFSVSFGIALQTIHIYEKTLHKVLIACWFVGLVGSIALDASPLMDHGVVVSTFQNPALLLVVGWEFVALTGLFLKEAVCFGRTEAKALIILTPLLSAGHFLGALSFDTEKLIATALSTLFLVFSIRKLAKPTIDDVGDMSVFHHLQRGGKLY